jgi:hypothetical protein
MLTLHAVTGGIRDGRHQHYPTPHIQPRSVDTETAAEETAVRLLRAYGAIGYLKLADDSGAEVRVYRRGDFFHSDSPLRDAHHRVVAQDLADRTAEK